MKVLYIADDGTKFNSKDECEKHEKKSAKCGEVFANELLMYDAMGKRTTVPALATYIDIKTPDAMRLFFSIAGYGGGTYKGISSPGRYIFGIDAGVWTKYETLEKWLESSMKVFMIGNKPVNVTIDVGGLGLKFEIDRNKTVKDALDYAGIVMDGLKCNILMGKRGFLLTDDTMRKSFVELGVEDGCTLRLREEKEWE